MGILELFILAIGLSMDAFAVAICKGLSVQKLEIKHMLIVGAYFGGFQALMPAIGYLLGSQFEHLIVSVDHWIAFFLLLFIGVILLILVSLLFNWPGAIQPGGVMLCILLFNQPVDTYVAYSLNRIFDTGIGVIIAMLVNLVLPRERVVRWMDKLHMPHREMDK